MGRKPRNFLIGYSLAGFTISVIAMYMSGMEWKLACASIFTPIVVVGAIIRPYFLER
jgi:hypothetical protein